MTIEIVFLCSLILALVYGLYTVSMTFNKTTTGLVNTSEVVTITDDNGIIASPASIPAAQPGSLTTRTDNTHGTITATNSNHGITTGQRIDLYWTGGQAYNVTVGTVSGTSIPITVTGGGSNLPSSSTAVTMGISTSAPFSITGNNLQALVLSGMPSGTNGYFVFNNGSTDVYAAFLTGGYVSGWKTGDVSTNPLASATPTLVYISHSNTAQVLTSLQAAAIVH